MNQFKKKKKKKTTNKKTYTVFFKVIRCTNSLR